MDSGIVLNDLTDGCIPARNKKGWDPMDSMKRQTNPEGFTLIELLIALSISAILLTSLATAFNASMVSYRENQDIFYAINTARQAMARMTTQLRTGQNVAPAEPSNRCSFFTANGQDITYEYRSFDSTLYLIDNSSHNEYILCPNVTAMTFVKTLTDDGLDCKSVQIAMTVQSGNTQQQLSSAVVIRRNLAL